LGFLIIHFVNFIIKIELQELHHFN